MNKVFTEKGIKLSLENQATTTTENRQNNYRQAINLYVGFLPVRTPKSHAYPRRKFQPVPLFLLHGDFQLL